MRPVSAAPLGPLAPASARSAEAVPPRAYSLPLGLRLFLACKAAGLVLWLGHHPLAALWVFFAPAPWFICQMVIPTTRGFGPAITHFTTAEREVWLTIDDGPAPATTPEVLDLLDAHRARATFFVIGEQAARHPDLLLEIVRRGHTLGNHSQTHPARTFCLSSARRVSREIDRCNDALRTAGSSPLWFRPPVGLKSVFLHSRLARRGMHLVLWSARGYDSLYPPAAATKKIMRDVRPGAIILCHEGSANRVDVVRRILSELAAQNYSCVVPRSEQLFGPAA
jgi:peptidoglycan/xylan/chitin deacetylase (PgdA/CDA1 family)